MEVTEQSVPFIYQEILDVAKLKLARQIGEEFFQKGSRDSEGLTFVATLNAETLENAS